MVVSAYTVQKVRNGYWITRLAPSGDRTLSTNLDIEPPPLRFVARTILDDCGYVSYADAADEFAQRFLLELTDTTRGVVTIAASKIDRWVAGHAARPPL